VARTNHFKLTEKCPAAIHSLDDEYQKNYAHRSCAQRVRSIQNANSPMTVLYVSLDQMWLTDSVERTMTTEREVTNDCIAIAFYGINADADSRRLFYSDLIEWVPFRGISA
jgi:hypothetical protein